MDRRILYDTSGQRSRWTMRAFLALPLLIVIGAAGFAMTLVNAPADADQANRSKIPGPPAMSLREAA